MRTIKGSGCSEAPANLLGFGSSRLYVVMMLFHPESYREGSLPSPEGLPAAAQEHRAPSWLPGWTISWPQLKKLHTKVLVIKDFLLFSYQENNPLHTRNETRNQGKT